MFGIVNPNSSTPSLKVVVVAGSNKYPTAEIATKRLHFNRLAVVTDTISSRKYNVASEIATNNVYIVESDF
ncbi:hypothetical protein [Clostridioides difficile]|uniref:hypothetical protein n=1 Tax=Clostridioides difficile TaxID=1496 RepID=UPI0031B5A7E6